MIDGINRLKNVKDFFSTFFFCTFILRLLNLHFTSIPISFIELFIFVFPSLLQFSIFRDFFNKQTQRRGRKNILIEL